MHGSLTPFTYTYW